MTDEKKYYDTDGNEVTLYKLIQLETGWAKNRILSLEAQVEVLTEELRNLLKAEGMCISIPSDVMEQQFGYHYKRGLAAGKHRQSVKLIGLLNEAACYDIGVSLLADINKAIKESEL